MKILADEIAKLDFDSVFAIKDGHVVEVKELHAPEVHWIGPVNEYHVEGRGWEVQYHFHPSETMGDSIARDLLWFAEEHKSYQPVFVQSVAYDLDGDIVDWVILIKHRTES